MLESQCLVGLRFALLASKSGRFAACTIVVIVVVVAVVAIAVAVVLVVVVVAVVVVAFTHVKFHFFFLPCQEQHFWCAQTRPARHFYRYLQCFVYMRLFC